MTYLRIFRALMWKEFREALPVFFFSLAAVLLFSYSIASQEMNLHSGNKSNLNGSLFFISLSITFILAFVFFLPLSSREPERDTLIGFRTKPVPPELLTFLNWLSAFLLACMTLLIFGLSLVFFRPHSFSFGIPVGAEHFDISQALQRVREIRLTRVGILLGYGIPLLVLFSFFFYSLSSATANRLRSFALWLVISAVLFVTLLHTHQSLTNPTLPTLTDRIWFFFYTYPRLVIGLTTLFFLIPSFYLIRLRLSHRWNYWPVYAAALVASVALFFLAMQWQVGNRNVTHLAVVPAQNTDLLRSAVLEEMHGPYKIAVIGNEGQFNWINHYQHRSTNLTIPDASQPLMLTVSRVKPQTKEIEVEELFSQPIRELFQADDLPENDTFEKYSVWSNPGKWETGIQTEQSGLLIGQGFQYNLLIEYLKRFGGRPEDYPELIHPYLPGLNRTPEGIDEQDAERVVESLRSNYPGFFRFSELFAGPDWMRRQNYSLLSHNTQTFFLGHYTLNEDPAFTPVKRIQITYTTIKGRVTRTIESRQPGVFDLGNYGQLYQDIPLGVRSEELVTPEGDIRLLIHEEWEGNNLKNQEWKTVPVGDRLRAGELIETGRMLTALFNGFVSYRADNPSPIDSATGNRIFRINTGSGIHPLIVCYDLSEPETLKISMGAAFQKEFFSESDYIEFANGYSWDLHILSTLAVEGSRLYLLNRTDDEDTLSILDISDPSAVKEIKRETWKEKQADLSGYLQPTDSSTLTAKDGLLIAKDDYTVRAYSINDPDSPRLTARVVYPKRSNGIDRVALFDNEMLLIHKNKMLQRFGIGDSSGEKWNGEDVVYLTEIPEYRTLHRIFRGFESESAETTNEER